MPLWGQRPIVAPHLWAIDALGLRVCKAASSDEDEGAELLRCADGEGGSGVGTLQNGAREGVDLRAIEAVELEVVAGIFGAAADIASVGGGAGETAAVVDAVFADAVEKEIVTAGSVNERAVRVRIDWHLRQIVGNELIESLRPRAVIGMVEAESEIGLEQAEDDPAALSPGVEIEGVVQPRAMEAQVLKDMIQTRGPAEGALGEGAAAGTDKGGTFGQAHCVVVSADYATDFFGPKIAPQGRQSLL